MTHFISVFDAPGVTGVIRSFIAARLASINPDFVTQTDEQVWEDCTFASGLMAALNMGIDAPASRAEREALRRASGDLHGGSDLGDLSRAFKARYGVSLERPTGWLRVSLLSWLERRGGAVAQLVYRELGEPSIRWDRKFANRYDGGLHAVYLDHYDPDRGVFLMDPLGRGNYPGTREPFAGEYVPATRVVAALDAFRRRSNRSGFALALAPEPDAPKPAPTPPAVSGSRKEPMTNLFPLTVKRVVDLPQGVTMFKEASDSAGIYGHITKPRVTLGLVDATGTHYKVANGDYGVWVSRKELEDKGVRVRNRRLGDPKHVGS